jgi:peptidoglycan/LPS O-acetylase OafA/YrhL
MYWPINYHDWLRIFFIYFPNVECPRFTPPAWALTVELFFYILIGLGASRYRGVTLAWFFCSILYHIYAGIAGLEWPDRYFALEAASLPFSTGAMIFHYKKYIRDHLDKFKWINAGSGGGLLFIGFLVNWYIGYKLGLSKEVFFYTNYIICACAIIIFAVHPLQNKSICSWGEWIGRFSYPIYLLHYQAGFLTLLFLKYFNFDVERPSMLLFTLTIPLLLLLSSLFIYFIERPIENFRIKVRKR